jgi:hypothetical protein
VSRLDQFGQEVLFKPYSCVWGIQGDETDGYSDENDGKF